MKGAIWGLAIGCAIGYFIRKMQDDGQFECIGECADNCYSKSKEGFKNMVDAAKSKTEDLKDLLEKVVKKETKI